MCVCVCVCLCVLTVVRRGGATREIIGTFQKRSREEKEERRSIEREITTQRGEREVMHDAFIHT